MDGWVEIISFTYPHEAHLAKMFLESSDIEVIMKDELTVQVHNFLSNAIGGVKLFIENSKKDEALLLLKKGGYIESSHTKDEAKIEEFESEYETLCPYCGSENVQKKSVVGYAFVLSIICLGFPFPFLKKVYHCYDCRKEWKIKQ
ncbi:putative signal transducing protein [Dysgonomonas sp. Marseille-P4361]|uniref:putative signal transducing protein n=1 Tax=Dysgonomonas sp. Marseille-P4361 TaxID=2161820 RepID=UPI000D55B42B|nr:DUF2007 domain-containing protein [Dysgonomonas sp. Marseille-P4361]